jgi:two-component system cell cycle sensor histidine kinase/response regulator CckA
MISSSSFTKQQSAIARRSVVAAESHTSASDSPQPTGARTILVVDDDSTIRTLAALILKTLGFKTLVASNGLEALQALERNPQVDVVNGETAFRAMRQSWPGVAVVVISGFDAETVNERLGNPPPDGFVQKPFTIDKLSGALACTLN